MEGHDRQRYKAWHRMMMMMIVIPTDRVLNVRARLGQQPLHVVEPDYPHQMRSAYLLRHATLELNHRLVRNPQLGHHV